MADGKPTFGEVIRFPELPKNEAGVGVNATQGGDVGVTGQGSIELGKGASVSASGSYWKDKGWAVAAWFGWKR